MPPLYLLPVSVYHFDVTSHSGIFSSSRVTSAAAFIVPSVVLLLDRSNMKLASESSSASKLVLRFDLLGDQLLLCLFSLRALLVASWWKEGSLVIFSVCDSVNL